MSNAETQKEPQKRTRKGEERAREILAEARLIFALEGHAKLTLNKLAERLNIHKYNIQYYFQTRDELIRELLFSVIASEYDSEIQLFNNSETLSPEESLTAVARYLIKDLYDPIGHGFFTQLFALATSDAFIDNCVKEYYEKFIFDLASLLKRINPGQNQNDYRLKTILIIAIIDGLGVTLGKELHRLNENPKSKIHKQLRDFAVKQILSIAKS